MKYRIKEFPEIKQTVKDMKSEDLLMTVICPHFADNLPGVPRTTGAFFFHPAKDEILKERIRLVNEDREFPAIVVADVEGGAGFLEQGTKFPSMRACAEAGDPKLAYEMGRISAVEAGRLGFQWGLGPCVDILGNPDNPFTGNRSAGSNTDVIIEMSKAVIAGMQDHGMIATAKHFPGDGYSAYDQHLTTAVNPLSEEEWKKSYGKVYSALIEGGVKSIMPGHIALPSMDEIDAETGLYRPATLSKRLLTDLLKKELGFEGIIVSDAVNMGGFCGYMNLYRACAEFLEAGGDMLLFAQPDEMFMEEMTKLIENGTLKRETLEDRAYRVLCFAKEHSKTENACDYDKEEHQKIADRITELGMLIERDRCHLLPFPKKDGLKILYNCISWNGEQAIDREMIEELRKYADSVEVISDVGPDKTREMVRSNEYDLMVCRVNPYFGYALNSCRLAGPIARNMMMGWARFGTPVVFITDSNSLAKEYESVIDTLINTHGYAKRTAEYVVKRIFE